MVLAPTHVKCGVPLVAAYQVIEYIIMRGMRVPILLGVAGLANMDDIV